MTAYQCYDLINFALIIVLIIGFFAILVWFKKLENINRTKVLLSALEKGQEINPELLTPKKKKGVHSTKWGLLALLISGSGLSMCSICALIVEIIQTSVKWETTINGGVTHYINESNFIACAFFLAFGIALLIGFFVGKKLLKPELDKEDADAKK